jgi:hypothetical protein
MPIAELLPLRLVYEEPVSVRVIVGCSLGEQHITLHGLSILSILPRKLGIQLKIDGESIDPTFLLPKSGFYSNQRARRYGMANTATTFLISAR